MHARRAASALLAAAGAAASVALCAPANTAICILSAPPGAAPSRIAGSVSFVQRKGDAKVAVRVRASGLAPNSTHGFHVHALGDLTQGCISAGGHFNPSKKAHGGPSDAERHAGDLGNVVADAAGVVDVTFMDSVITLDQASAFSIIGRSCVLHADTDDLGKGGAPDSLTTGNAGARIACGVIGLGAEIEVA